MVGRLETSWHSWKKLPRPVERQKYASSFWNSECRRGESIYEIKLLAAYSTTVVILYFIDLRTMSPVSSELIEHPIESELHTYRTIGTLDQKLAIIGHSDLCW
jgi:hypothetical protein